MLSSPEKLWSGCYTSVYLGEGGFEKQIVQIQIRISDRQSALFFGCNLTVLVSLPRDIERGRLRVNHRAADVYLLTTGGEKKTDNRFRLVVKKKREGLRECRREKSKTDFI